MKSAVVSLFVFLILSVPCLGQASYSEGITPSPTVEVATPTPSPEASNARTAEVNTVPREVENEQLAIQRRQVEQNQTIANSTVVIMLLTGANVVVAVIFALIAFFQLRGNRRLIKASEASAEVARDAFKAGSVAHFGIPEIRWVDTGADSKPVLEVHFLNGGKTPAWHFHAFVTMKVVLPPDGVTNPHPKTRMYRLENVPEDLRPSFVTAGQEVVLCYESRAFSSMSQIRELGSPWVIDIWAIYQDFLGKRETFGFTVEYGGGDGNAFADVKQRGDVPPYYMELYGEDLQRHIELYSVRRQDSEGVRDGSEGVQNDSEDVRNDS